MKLTKKRAIELSIELWEWLAETGKEKEDWPEWKQNGGKHPDVMSLCFLCEFDESKRGICDDCPYFKRYGECSNADTPFAQWAEAETKTTSKKYAKLFLEQLNQLK